jgi:hypothetical protein
MVILRDTVSDCCDILNVLLPYVYIVFYSEHVLYYITYDCACLVQWKKYGINLA